MSIRVYLPVSGAQLAALVQDRRLPAPLHGHAVTEALREHWPEGDEDDWEYAALMAAGDDSLSRRGPSDSPRRRVIAADVAEIRERQADGEDDAVTLVEVLTDVVWKRVASAHLDTADDVDPSEDLAWFATQEIEHLI